MTHLMSSSFTFGLSLQLGVTTAYHYPPNLSVFNVCLLCTNFPISSFTTSTNLLFGIPLLFPGNSISIIFLPTYSWSLLMTCPYYLSLPSLIFIHNRSTLTVLLLVFSRHSHSKPQHFHLCDFHLLHLFLCDCHRLKSIQHCWSYH